jgi:biotin carboxylase
MRLLVTNTHAPQAHAVVRALRPYAERVVAVDEGTGLRPMLSHGSHSRLVDKRYRVPSPEQDWRTGRVSLENTPAEAAFVEAVTKICRDDRIDVIFPSWDPYVSVLSKNRAHFEAIGVTIPVPEFSTVLMALDKHRTIEAAQSAGFPCPRTYLYESREQLREIEEREGFPLVLKPRFTSGGRGMAIVNSRAELDAALPEILAGHGAPLVQEYIPGGNRTSVQLVLDKQGQIVFAFHKLRHRTFKRTARLATVSESARPDERVLQSAQLLQKLGWWGAMGIETILDPRDGLNKLMEVNPRFPRQLWNRTEMGINEPLLCVRIARDEQVEPVGEYPVGVLFVSPVEDVQLFALQLIDRAATMWRTKIAGWPEVDQSVPSLSFAEQWRSFIGTYRSGKRKIWDPYSRYFLQDPKASLLWWLQFSSWIAGAVKQAVVR